MTKVKTVGSVGHAHTVARCCVAPPTTAARAGTAYVQRLGEGFTVTVCN